MLNRSAPIARAQGCFLKRGGIVVALSCQTPATARADDYKPLGLTLLRALRLTGDGSAVASVNALLKALRQPSTHTKE